MKKRIDKIKFLETENVVLVDERIDAKTLVNSVKEEFETLPPEFNFKIEDMNIVKFTVELLTNLDMTTVSKSFINNRQITNFDDAVGFDEAEKNKFRNVVLYKDGYLLEESNYFRLNKDILTQGSDACTLRNQRVILYWRGIQLKDKHIRRILTMGLSLLIGAISEAELYTEVYKIIPRGTFEVFLRHSKKTFVLIRIEEPIFSF